MNKIKLGVCVFTLLLSRCIIAAPAVNSTVKLPKINSLDDIDQYCKSLPQTDDRCDHDSDEDSIPDLFDQCKQDVEDFDKFEDFDGCPDVDNDMDGFFDNDDQCPNYSEIVNGYSDQDGCPDINIFKILRVDPFWNAIGLKIEYNQYQWKNMYAEWDDHIVQNLVGINVQLGFSELGIRYIDKQNNDATPNLNTQLALDARLYLPLSISYNTSAYTSWINTSVGMQYFGIIDTNMNNYIGGIIRNRSYFCSKSWHALFVEFNYSVLESQDFNAVERDYFETLGFSLGWSPHCKDSI